MTTGSVGLIGAATGRIFEKMSDFFQPELPPSGVRNRRILAFTLIELLVVISIMGMLVSLLMPALREAKESARTVQCLNNLRQQGIAIHAYGNDFALYPWCTFSNPEVWYVRLGSYLQKNTQNAGGPSLTTDISPIFQCPSSTFKPTIATNFFVTYSPHHELLRNWFILPAGNKVQTPYPLKGRPADVIMVIDACQMNLGGNKGFSAAHISQSVDWYQAYNPATANALVTPGLDIDDAAANGHVRWRHKGGANSLFADGHIAILKKDGLLERMVKVNADEMW